MNGYVPIVWCITIVFVAFCLGGLIAATIMQQHPVIRDVVTPVELTQVTTDTVRINDTLAVAKTAYVTIDSIPDIKVGIWAINYYDEKYISENYLNGLVMTDNFEYVIQKMIYKIDSIKADTLCYVLKERK